MAVDPNTTLAVVLDLEKGIGHNLAGVRAAGSLRAVG